MQNIPQAGLRCNVNWGDKHTFTTADNGCKYEGAPQVGGVPAGWYANTASGNVLSEAVFTASVVTLRRADDGVVPLHPEGGVASTQSAQASAPPAGDIPPAGMRCNINFGTAQTRTTADNGCKYEGAKRQGGVPEGWSADTPQGKVTGPTVIDSDVVTLRRVDGGAVPVLPDSAIAATASAAATASTTTTRVIVCPTTGDGVAREFGVPNDQVSLVGQYFTRFDLEPGGKTWIYNKTVDGKRRDGPTLEFSVPGNWTVDHPGGDGAKTGTPVTASVFTARCGQ